MPRPVRSRPLQMAPLLLEAHPWIAVLLLTVLVAVGAFAILVLFLFTQAPTGPAKTIDAQVVGLRLVETDLGSFPRARARLPSGREVNVRIRRAERCAVGDRIRLRETPGRWGRRMYAVTPEACLR